MPDIPARNILLLNTLEEIEPFLLKENIEIIILKGAALIELDIFDISEREMSDLDILLKEKDSKKFIKILKNIGFAEMPNSSSAFIKNIKENFLPIIINLHTYLPYIKNIDELFNEKIKIRNNIYSLSIPDIIIFSIVHSILNHGYFDLKTKNDIKKIFEKYKTMKENLLTEISKKSEKLKISKLIHKALLECEIGNTKNKFNIKEFFLTPFINLAFKKHYNFNEYILPVFYTPSYAFKMIFPDREFMLKRYGSDSLKIRIKRFFQLIINSFLGNK